MLEYYVWMLILLVRFVRAGIIRPNRMRGSVFVAVTTSTTHHSQLEQCLRYVCMKLAHDQYIKWDCPSFVPASLDPTACEGLCLSP
jgi:hypothetical protein